MEERGFWARVWISLKGTFSWFSTKMIGPLIAVVLILGAVLLASMGFKELQIGGLLGKVLGRKPEDEAPEKGSIELANSIDKDRLAPNGKLIQPGTPDSTGQTQAIVVPIKDPGLFSDPKKVVFVPPGETQPVEVVLPDGVTNNDVEAVVVVKPHIVAVTVKDTSGIPAQRVEDLLSKYDR